MFDEMKSPKGETEKMFRETQSPKGEMKKRFRETQSPKGEMKKRFDEMKSAKGEMEKRFDEMKSAKGETEKMFGEMKSPKGETEKMFGEMKSPKGEMKKRFDEMKSAKGEMKKRIGEMKSEIAGAAKLFQYSPKNGQGPREMVDGRKMPVIESQFNFAAGKRSPNLFGMESLFFITPCPRVSPRLKARRGCVREICQLFPLLRRTNNCASGPRFIRRNR